MSQEQMSEMDRILKLWAESYNKQFEVEPQGCRHEGKYYIGFREEYEFCVKCDAKKINDQWVESPKH
jgi:hypothetical protein